MRFVGTALVAGTIGISFLLAQGGCLLEGTGRSAEVEKATPRTSQTVLLGYSHFPDFRGMTVENVDGQKVGTLSDLILELQSARPAYVIVRAAGFVGNRRLVIAPTSAIALETAKAGIAAMDITKRQWKHAPEFSKSDLPLLGQPEKARQIARFYGRVEGNTHVATNTDEQKTSLSSTGPGADQSIGATQHVRYASANDLMGAEVIARQQLDIGKVTGLLVDLTGTKPTFAIVSADRLSGTDGHFAVPLQLLRLMPGHKIAISANRQNFQRARPLAESDSQILAADGAKEIYRYER
jgi:sporulation protein YlmC with PRC-barrel domain